MTNKRKKFLFDLHDFQKEAEEEKERRKNKNPPPPMFSLEDMESARQHAFEAGKQEGLQQAKDSIEQQTEIAVQSLTDAIKTLEEAEASRYDAYLNHSVAMAYKALKKALSPLLDVTREDQIKAALQTFFQDNTQKSDLTLFVHSSMVTAIEKHAKGLSPTMVVEKDDTLSAAQARIEWTNGIFEFKPDALVVQILQLFEKQLPDSEPSLDEQAKTQHNEEAPAEDQSEKQDP